MQAIFLDTEYVLNHISADPTIFPQKDSGPSSTNVKIDTGTDSYKSIPEEVINKIRKIYALDFQLFGYDPYRIRGRA